MQLVWSHFVLLMNAFTFTFTFAFIYLLNAFIQSDDLVSQNTIPTPS